MHRGNEINNGSVLSIESIGEGSMALVCNTTNENCCRSPKSKRGEWYYPNGTLVPLLGDNYRFYRNRSSRGEVFLHQRRIHVHSSRTGIYCCEIPDRNDNCGINQKLCVNLGTFSITVYSCFDFITPHSIPCNNHFIWQ